MVAICRGPCETKNIKPHVLASRHAPICPLPSSAFAPTHAWQSWPRSEPFAAHVLPFEVGAVPT